MIQIEPIMHHESTAVAHLLEELVGKPSNMEKLTKNLDMMIEKPEYILLGAKDDGKVVGFLMGIVCLDLVEECNPFMVIENVIVSKDVRGRHIGKMLIEAIEEEAKQNHCTYTMLVSSSYRKEAHRFYESVGYPMDMVQGFKKFL